MTVEEIYQEIEKEGIVEVLRKSYGKNIHVRIGFSKSACETEIDDLSLSVRSLNGLKRTAHFTIGDVIETINQGELLRIRNLGIKSYYEIRLKLLEFGYMRLSPIEKKEFIRELMELNKNNM